jgi:hypothetical protein
MLPIQWMADISNVVKDLKNGFGITPVDNIVIDNYTYQNLLAGIIRKEIEIHRLISDELRLRFDKLKGEYSRTL